MKTGTDQPVGLDNVVMGKIVRAKPAGILHPLW